MFSVEGILGGSWVVMSGDRSPLIWVVIIVTLFITPYMTTHEPPSRVVEGRRRPRVGLWA